MNNPLLLLRIVRHLLLRIELNEKIFKKGLGISGFIFKKSIYFAFYFSKYFPWFCYTTYTYILCLLIVLIFKVLFSNIK